MAIARATQQLTLQVSLILFLSWFILTLWSISQWVLHEYWSTYHKLTALITSQRNSVRTVYAGSLLSYLPFDNQSLIRFTWPDLNTFKTNTIFKNLLAKGQQLGQILLLSSHYFFIKLMILFAALPWLLSSFLASVVDGLSKRAIRTACLGRESAYLFHRLPHYLRVGLQLALLGWLALPICVNPAAVFIPVSTVMSVLVIHTVSHFKKYL